MADRSRFGGVGERTSADSADDCMYSSRGRAVERFETCRARGRDGRLVDASVGCADSGSSLSCGSSTGKVKRAPSPSSPVAGRSVDPLEGGAATRKERALLGEANGLRTGRRDGVTAGEMLWPARAVCEAEGVVRGRVGVVR